MSTDVQTILGHLLSVARERQLREETPHLVQRVLALKQFQHARLAGSYADLLAVPRYEPAARFFLEDLYGPNDFTDRDTQFARIVPALVRLFPGEIVATVMDLAALHALSESLDTRVAQALMEAAGDTPGETPITAETYARAWAAVGQREQRMQQIRLTRRVGDALDLYTHRRGLRRTLHLMRLPARAAGLQALHRFLERGFDTFHAMHGAAPFLDRIEQRETRLAQHLFEPDAPRRARELGLVALADAMPGQLP